jgi:hypothetical protein
MGIQANQKAFADETESAHYEYKIVVNLSTAK